MNGSNTDLASYFASLKTPVNDEVGDRALTARLIRGSSRIDVDSLMNEFRRELGPLKWEQYRDSLTHFLMGKLSRPELVKCLKETLGLSGAAMRNHNTLVLSLLANACREAPPGTESSLAEWKATTRGGKLRHSQMDSANDRLHREILSLPVRERRRIKNIAKESMAALKQPLIPPQPPVLVATRQAMLPHIPYMQDTTRDSRSGSPASGSKGSIANTSLADAQKAAAVAAKSKDKDSTPTNSGASATLTDPLLGLHPGRTSGPLNWTQDIIQGLDIPLISESHEVPDDTALGTRMLGIALEHGVLGGIGAGTTDMMLVGLEYYLRGIVDKLVAMKHRHIDGESPLTAADLHLMAEMEPSELGEISAPLYRLSTTFLEDEESVVPRKSSEPSSSSRKRRLSENAPRTPLDIAGMQKLPRLETDNEARVAALDEHENGIDLLTQLLN